MPLPLSRLFPKIKSVSNDASLILSADAIAIFRRPAADLPVRRAPKQFPILAEREFKFILQTNHSNLPISLLVDHFKRLLESRATSLGLSSIKVIQDHILLVTTNESSSSTPSFLPHAILDRIVLDYRFRIPNLTELYDGSQSQEPLLPLKELLDPALQRLVCIHFIRQLPLVFGGWNDVFEDDAFLSKRIGRAVKRIVSRSKDAVFCRHLQESTSTMGHSLNKLHNYLLEQVVDEDQALAEENLPPDNTANVISRSLLVTSQAHFRPKPLKRNTNIHSFDERDMLEESQAIMMDDQESEHDAQIPLEFDAMGPPVPERSLFPDETEYSSAEYEQCNGTGLYTLQVDGGNVQDLRTDILEVLEDEEGSHQTKTRSLTGCFDEDGQNNLLPFEDEDPDRIPGLEQHNTDEDDMLFD